MKKPLSELFTQDELQLLLQMYPDLDEILSFMPQELTVEEEQIYEPNA